MSVREVYDNPGSFEVRLVKDTPPEILNAITELDHLVIHAQGQSDAHLQRYTDATLLSEARYAGPILNIDFEDEPFIIRGAGLLWWWEDHQGHGAVIAEERTYSSATLSTVVDDYTDGGIIPFNFTQGTITNPVGKTYNGTFYPADTSLHAIRTVMKQLGCHYRVNPDGTVDAGPDDSNEVYLVDESDGGKLAVVIRNGWGSDPLRQSVELQRLRVSRDMTNWVSRVATVEEEYDGSNRIGPLLNREHNYYGLRNLPAVRTRKVSRPSSDSSIDITEFLTSELEQANLSESIDLDMSQWELADGQIAVGDFAYVYDPESGIFDTTNEIQHRGQRIYPKRIRILEADWPVTKGQGVYVRPGGSAVTAADWIDVSPYVEWERIP